ncbi:hypothetical protein BDV32DRAFT_126354 [Aspergillus pseudonomiae]|uniref:HAM1-like N-terminal domain-containing protein n=1 Tax=Aspergillus pseudonomiae TaxID=1506151 RepID=A0A5N7DMJ4_9EURO|nr:uncharacterized protein BDV37DRAFT_290347 [Aspergillus pseudonomiae]KAB8258082.1 hypothetical protein BDV32DRAFT_126354 [Aspergillus pseudonomiae]KAE8407677.1 hypothetical protein BDV37DRAFT_290347 [Aspergillus pseudonomiae]
MSQETEPLLPRYEEDTTLQRRLHQKLHSFQMLRALSEGYLPSTDQVIINLRTLLASDILNPRTQDIGSVGRQLIRDCRIWIQVFIELLRDKNSDDKLQEFLWHLSRSRVSLDRGQVAQHASHVKARQDTKAAYDSLRTVGSLLLTNADFRLFVDDLTTVGRQIFSDTAYFLSDTSKQVGEQIKPSQEEVDVVQGAGADDGQAPSSEELRQEVAQVVEAAGNGAARTGQEAIKSAKEHLRAQEKDTLIYRLKQAVLKLRERSDYSDSVATLATLVQRYAKTYANAASDIITTTEEEVEVNEDLKQAMQQFWALVQSLGDAEQWKALEQRFQKVLQHAHRDPEFERLMGELGSSVQQMLTDPSFFDSASEKLSELEEKSKKVVTESNLRQDVDAFLEQAKRALRTVPEDAAVTKLLDATNKLYKDAWDGYYERKSELPSDILEVFFPVLLRTIQHIPIPRLEVMAPELDLLLENFILEPGHTVNYSSFLPYRLHLTTRNDIDVLKRHSKRTTADLKTTFTATVMGLNVSASEFGYWLRTHSGLFRFHDEGIASFYLDKRGIDISLDIEVGRERLEQIFTLRGVRVVIHKLDYKVHRSKWKYLLWLTKPFLKHMLRRVLEKKIAERIVAAAFALNRELVFARERLRAARIANPQDLATFVRAVLARLQPVSDVETRIGFDAPGKGVFKGVYAPGSLTKVWHEEALRAQEAIEEGDESYGLRRTWRNDIFNVPTRSS